MDARVKPTLKGITDITMRVLLQHDDYDPISAAKAIHALFVPELKPLSDMVDDKEACRKLFEFFMGEPMRRCKNGAKHLLMEGNGTDFYLSFDGDISWFGDPKSKPTIFAIVDFIRSLGYQPKAISLPGSQSDKFPLC